MTNPVNSQVPKYQAPPPANYSGVTINVLNPSLTSSPYACAYPANQNYVNSNPQIQSYNQQYETNSYQENQPQQASYPVGYYINNYNQQPQNSNIQPQNSPYLTQAIPQENYQTYPAQKKAPENSYSFYEQQQSLNTSKEIINKLNTIAEEEKEQENKGVKTEVTILTNEYIMSLENILNNPDKSIRRKGASEVLNRLGEDPTRKDDAALNALLNKMIQDPDKGVRILALSALAEGLATGNDYTVKLLKHMEANPNKYPDDMDSVMSALLKMSAGTKTIYVEQ